MAAPNSQPSALSEDLCPKCNNNYLTKPKASSGYYSPENTGRMYQECPDNTHDDGRLCDGFFWRDDLPKPTEQVTKYELCPGPTCQSRQKARALHQRCVHRYCIECCRNVSTTTCRAPRHSTSSTVPSASIDPTVTAQDPTSDIVSTTAVTSRTSSGPFGKMLSPIYAQKLAARDFEVPVGVTNMQQRNQYQKESISVVRVRWWNEDGKLPLDFTVPVPQYPWFHPKDCTVISEVIGPSNCKIYGVFVAGHWTITSLAQNVKPGSVLNLRSRDVTHCPGLDDLVEQSPKVSEGSSKASPQKRARSISNVSVGSLRVAIRMKSEGDDVIILSSDEEPDGPPTSSPGATSPRVSPELDENEGGSDLLVPPRGSRSAWPYRYACDMADGFRNLERLKDTGLSSKAAFLQLFPNLQWKPSTFSDNLAVWKGTPTAEMSKAIGKGRANGGEWNAIAKRYGKRRN